MHTKGQSFRIRMTVVSGAQAVNTAVINKAHLTQAAGVPYSATTGGTNSFIDTKLSNVNTWLGRTAEWISCTNATNNNQRRIVTGYTVATQTATNSLALPAAITAGDTYRMLSPVPEGVGIIALAGITVCPMTTVDLNDISPVFAMTNADGDRFASQLVEGTTVNFWPGMMFPTPVEFPFHQDVTLTASLATAVNWPANIQIFWHFVY